VARWELTVPGSDEGASWAVLVGGVAAAAPRAMEPLEESALAARHGIGCPGNTYRPCDTPPRALADLSPNPTPRRTLKAREQRGGLHAPLTGFAVVPRANASAPSCVGRAHALAASTSQRWPPRPHSSRSHQGRSVYVPDGER